MSSRPCGMVILAGLLAASTGTASAASLLVDDFNLGEKPNALGGDYGAISCVNSFDKPNAYGEAGYALRLDYDVDAPRQAYSGFWMRLQGVNVSRYQHLVLYVKGDAARGYTSQITLELKNGREVGKYLLSGIGDEWQRVAIPLKAFAGITDWRSLTELVIVFDGRTSTRKAGTMYLDEISFEN